MHRSDYAVLVLLGVLLFGYSAISGKPLTMHEARLPQTSLEMLASGEWLFPHSGERPWLERPPLPHWFEIAVGRAVGRLDEVWIVRIPPALMGLASLLMVGWMAARLFGRATGLLAAIALATMYEFAFYAGQAEDDIFLAALVTACFALFVASEFPADERASRCSWHFLGNRPPSVWAFFIVLGLTNLAKGPLVGAVLVISGTGAFLLLSDKRERIFRYVWLWGWALFLVIGFAWPLAAYRAYPSILENWRLDYSGNFERQPVWYYLVALLWTAAPWTPVMLIGLGLAFRDALRQAHSPQRLVCCVAMVPLLVLSIHARKHHHYLLPLLPAWAVLAALGAQQLGQWLFQRTPNLHPTRDGLLYVGLPGALALTAAAYWQLLPGPGWALVGLAAVWIACVAVAGSGLVNRSGQRVLAGVLIGFVFFNAWAQSVLGTVDENKWGDVPLAQRTRSTVPAEKPLMIEASGSMDFFRFQFYSRRDAQLIHNITFLRDQRITAPEVYVLARSHRRKFIQEELGDCEVIDRSSRSRRETSPEERWTLFLVRFKPGLVRYPVPTVSVLQAMDRGTGAQAGPYCGPPPEA